ncbi:MULTISPECIES: pseudouridine synthase [unclassified Prochlorococcus]|uniref:pseudouridine synthase n=1 Tax=unclassified Prochlorococcus TaxID=2627481 RepID=UPI000533B522|nr:16S rRNA pseudouridylate synthase [Prochlorococcus sp. MIT 0602]KGG17718.1 16S rRNA pseudouridylate synthase [Prochlorococcus sp. MIT 0603]
MQERLQKIISRAGICSRRKAEQLLLEKRIYVNGSIAAIGEKADITKDKVSIDNYILTNNIECRVILLNKPSGVICSCRDTHSRETVIDLLPNKYKKGMYPVGRLDKNSRGAILITNNGLLTYQLTHPSYDHKKVYEVLISGQPTNGTLSLWRKGIKIDGKLTKTALIEILAKKGSNTLLKVVLTEGRKRQIRKTAAKFGHSVIDLNRVEIASIKLNGLREGQWRELNQEEWHLLLK